MPRRCPAQPLRHPTTAATSLPCAAAEAPDDDRDDELAESPDDGHDDAVFPNTGAAAHAPYHGCDEELLADIGACSSLI